MPARTSLTRCTPGPLPQAMVKGSATCAVAYAGHVYRMATARERTAFLEEPWRFAHVNVPSKVPPTAAALDPAAELRFQGLPHIGYMEVSLGQTLLDAVTQVGTLRPRHPGLGTADSALKYMALYLKVRLLQRRGSPTPRRPIHRMPAPRALVGPQAHNPKATPELRAEALGRLAAFETACAAGPAVVQESDAVAEGGDRKMSFDKLASHAAADRRAELLAAFEAAATRPMSSYI